MSSGNQSTGAMSKSDTKTEASAKINRILHLSATNFFGGPEKQIIGHALAVDRQQFEVLVAAFAEQNRETELVLRARDAGLTSLTVAARNAYDFRCQRRINRLLIDEKIDLLVTHNYRSNLLGRRAARAKGIKHVAVSRGWTSENLKVRFYHWLDKKTLHKSDMVICVSRDKKKELLAAGVDETRLVVIPNAADIQRKTKPAINWRQRFGWDADTKLIISAGRLSAEKGPDLFLAAINEIKQSLPLARYIIFGAGPLVGELRRKIEELHLSEVVQLAGHVPELEKELPAFDILVNPSRSEGLPNIVLEAMVTGLPIVATAVGGVKELLTDGQTGRLVPPQPAALAGALRETLANMEIAAQCAERAQESVRTNYSFAVQARRYEQVYHRLLTENGKAR